VRELPSGEIFVSGAREEIVTSAAQLMKALDDGSRHRVTASTLMNLTSSRSHGECGKSLLAHIYEYLQV
jgi:Kinesin motor domain